MKELVLRFDLSDIRLSVILFQDAFCIKSQKNSALSLTNLRFLHQHSFFEVFFIKQGAFSVVTEQSTVRGKQSLLIVPPFVNHYTEGTDFEAYAMYFSLEHLQNSPDLLYNEVIQRLSKGITQLPLTEDLFFYIDHIAQGLANKQPAENIQYFLPLLFLDIFSPMKRQGSNPASQIGKRSKHINIIESYISAHYCEELHLSDIADALYLCAKQVSRIIRKEYSCSFSELVTRYRLNAACMLLKHTTISIRKVASNVGFRDRENYFFMLFRKQYGVTPTQYRKNIHQTQLSF
ncbi:MAG: helix-turn-helix transcriptional regulator [Clostridia bacterium]|nr:helix-turn-helix transcriptional regulator [Clostridia bacterium]